MTGTYIQTVAALAFVIILIIAAGYLMRKRQTGTGLMSIVSYQPFGPKKGVTALKVGNEVLILGVTPNDIRLLKTFKEGELDLPEKDAFQSKLEKYKAIGANKS